jgi:hypothetical protein
MLEQTPAPPAPAEAPSPAKPAAALAVAFSGLPAGSYPVHLHRICSGAQGYHLSYLPTLYIGASSSGAIEVPSSDFGQGWCVIVYRNASLSSVVATRPI